MKKRETGWKALRQEEKYPFAVLESLHHADAWSPSL